MVFRASNTLTDVRRVRLDSLRGPLPKLSQIQTKANRKTYAHILRQKSHSPSIQPFIPMLSVPPSNLLQPWVNRPLAQRPFILFLDDIDEAGVCNHSLERVGDVDLFSEDFGAFDGELGAVVEGVARFDGIVVGF